MCPVVSVVASVGKDLKDQVRESGVGEGIVPRRIMSMDGTLTEVVRRKGPAKSPMLAANLQDLGNP